MSDEQFLRVKDVVAKTTLSRATIYRKVEDGSFPRPTRLSHRVSVWPAAAVNQWMEQVVAQ